MAGPLSRLKSAIILWSGASRPISHISSTLHDGTFRDMEEVLWFYARRDVERNGSSVLLIENEEKL
jgi:hypothetical protein